MNPGERIEQTLEQALSRARAPGGPPTLAAAMRHAVFPGGARVRPMLALAVADACGDDGAGLAPAAAAAIEMLHCASLAHDDLPCFDDAMIRRGRLSTHAAYGEPLALLAGDALIVLAFETVAAVTAARPERAVQVIAELARGVGAPHGIAAGQAWESEPDPPIATYHRAKTGALFVAAAACGALSAGADPAAWRPLGAKLGEAYQVADDLMDAVGAAEECGKPVGRDAALHRPSAAADLGVAGAVRLLESLVAEAADAIPPCAGAGALKDLVRAQARRLVPKQLAQAAA